MAAAGKAPTRGHAVAALDDPRCARPRTPGEDAARPAEDLARRLGIEIGRGHRAACGLVEAPSGRGVGLGDLLDDRNEDGGKQLGAPQRPRQQQAEEPALDECGDDRLGQLAPALDLVRRSGELGCEFAGPPHPVGGGIVCRQAH